MKAIVALLACVALCAGSALPSDRVPKDNSQYVESDAGLQSVNLQSGADEGQFDGARNSANPKFWLYTRKNPNNHQILIIGDYNSVRNSNYQGDRPTHVIVHGWKDDGNSKMNIDITSALLDQDDCNVIVVDWGQVAADEYYPSVCEKVLPIGRFLGNFIDLLFRLGGGNYDQLHLIGFCLGAHIVGVAGRTLYGKPRRVTGLDPAGVFWRDHPDRLTRNSGLYVEAIHTEGMSIGIFDPTGHADFYPNTGKHVQPGCLPEPGGPECSHRRAYEFFVSSIRTNHFIGHLCLNIREAGSGTCRGSLQLRMGNADFEKTGNGMYGLTTASSWPY